MPADLAYHLKADEEERKTDNAPVVAATENEVVTVAATIETKLWHGDPGVAADSVKGDVAETENAVAGDEASSEWEERQKSRVESPQLMRRFFVAVRQHGWMCAQKRLWFACESAGNSIGGRATAPRQCCVLYV